MNTTVTMKKSTRDMLNAAKYTLGCNSIDEAVTTIINIAKNTDEFKQRDVFHGELSKVKNDGPRF